MQPTTTTNGDASRNVVRDQTSGAMASAVRLSGVTKRYKGNAAVEDFDLEVRRGELLTLLGPSGCGKSTTLGLIAGFTAPDSGTIEINGAVANALSPRHRDISVVFQDYALFPHMSVGKNVAFPLAVRRLPRHEIRDRVENILARVHLPGFADRAIHELSGGQRQRVALARALIVNPAVLLMDEPLSALDKSLRASMQLELVKLHEEFEATIVYVTHDQEEALVLSDRIAVMNQGRIVQIGSPREIYASPRSRFAAEFIGTSNILPGTFDPGASIIRVAGGVSLTAAGQCDVQEPGSAIAAFRPEDVVLNHIGSGNTLQGRVVRSIYVGDRVNVDVDLGEGITVTATVPASRPAPANAAQVKLHIDPSAVHVFSA